MHDNPEVEVEKDDNIISDRENSYSEDTEVLLEHVYNENFNPYEVGDESGDISTTSRRVFEVEISVSPMEEEYDERQVDYKVMQVPENNHPSVVQYHEVNLEVEQARRDDNRISDMENSYCEDREVLLEHVYNEIPNPYEVGDESRDISTTPCMVFGIDISESLMEEEDDDESPGVSRATSITLFGVTVRVPPMDEEDDEQQTDHNVMQVPENNHPSVVHYPEEEVDMNMGTLESMPNSIFNLDYDDDFTLFEGGLQLEEQTEQVDSRLSEETIMRHGEFEDGESIGGLHCGHKYHVQCIKKWLQQMNNCPVCKATAVV
ncbi:hypothetical protein AgCh_007500 [Apium graveolens]